MTPAGLVIRPEVAGESLVRAALAAMPAVQARVTEAEARAVFPGLAPWRILVLDRFKGELVKPLAPAECSLAGRPEAFLACGVNCPGRCRYCFLKTCATVPYPVFYANVADMAAELDAALAAAPDLYVHLGHILDPLAYPFLAPLVGAFAAVLERHAGAMMELRTKFTAIDLLPAPPPANLRVAFSLAPAPMARRYEPGTPGVKARLRALALLARRGYRLGVRLDPVLLPDGWEADYAALCADIRAALRAAEDADIVLGTLRGPPALIGAIRADDPGEALRRGEFIRTRDGKLGYPRPLRLRALRFLTERLGTRFPIRTCGE
ncbi:MAG TPA: hypothetical protein PKX48_02030 [Planctomycetota bacterium]|nr:hypothetical protein [Planctomycetota bacterium]OQC21584.1 MAG: Spore photoproduct lyase [Planctomycetes bacterium ADurb.Bin069]HNR98550.1 hypothetical protein [Planctomycetota bacterium]HNU26902.1 hypothetical protein [Planctomycetota bacterium]HOE28774.1 hypothetical protein [Planctomycetota bacterium]